MTRNDELAGRTVGQEMWALCLREHIEQRRLAPPGECELCDNARRYEENERLRKDGVVQGEML